MDDANLTKQVNELTNRVLILEKMVAYLLYTEPREDQDEMDLSYANPFNTITDEEYKQAWKIVSDSGKASVSYLQRRMSFGYNKASLLMDRLENDGIVGKQEGAKPREVLKKYHE